MIFVLTIGSLCWSSQQRDRVQQCTSLLPAEEEEARMVEVECPVYLQMELFLMGTGRGGRFVLHKFVSDNGFYWHPLIKVTILAVLLSSVLTCLCGAAFNGPRWPCLFNIIQHCWAKNNLSSKGVNCVRKANTTVVTHQEKMMATGFFFLIVNLILRPSWMSWSKNS